MTRHRIEATYSIETSGPLHIGTGRGTGGLQRAMFRDHLGLPYIPGSTIKGRARHAAIQICRWLQLSVSTETAHDVLPHSGQSPNGPHGTRDLPTRIFGCAWSRCILRFGDARAEPPSVDRSLSTLEQRSLRDSSFGLRELRTGAARSRVLGTVSHRRLYKSEVAPPGLIFRGDVRGYLDCVDSTVGASVMEFPAEVLVLWLALHLMVENGIGGNKSAGSGKLSWVGSQRIAMKVDDSLFTPSDDDADAHLDLLTEVESRRCGS